MFEDEHEIMARIEAEELLSKSREGIIQLAYGRLDEAMVLEAKRAEQNDIAVYFWHDDNEEDSLVVMLTRDGIYPFGDEIDDKEQLLIKFTAENLTSVQIEHVKEGDRIMYELHANDLRVITDFQLDGSDEEPSLEPTIEDITNIERPAMTMSEMSRLALLREKIRRFELTRKA